MKEEKNFKVVVACQGGENCANSHLFIGYDKCSHSARVCNGDKACKAGCLGYGDCEVKCPKDAIIINGEVAQVDQKLCNKCEKCISACPKNVIKKIDGSAKVFVACNQVCTQMKQEHCSKACTSCGKCKKACPHKAITLKKGEIAKIDYSKCTGCLMCLNACPSGVIKRI